MTNQPEKPAAGQPAVQVEGGKVQVELRIDDLIDRLLSPVRGQPAPARTAASQPAASQPAGEQVSHLFQVQLRDVRLTAEQANRIAAAIRGATTNELLKLDFRIEELKPLYNRGADIGGNCGGCSQCSR